MKALIYYDKDFFKFWISPLLFSFSYFIWDSIAAICCWICETFYELYLTYASFFSFNSLSSLQYLIKLLYELILSFTLLTSFECSLLGGLFSFLLYLLLKLNTKIFFLNKIWFFLLGVGKFFSNLINLILKFLIYYL